MRRVLLLIALSFVCSVGRLGAQQFTQGYLDSVQEFFGDFAVSYPEINQSIIDDYWSDSTAGGTYNSMVRWFSERISEKSLKIFGGQFDSSVNGGRYVDSITINQKDLKLIFQKIKESKSHKFPQAYFPQSKFVKSGRIGTALTKARQEHHKFASWTFTLPVFLRNGNLAVCYYCYLCGGDCGHVALIAYKNKNGHWQKFGETTQVWF